MKKTIAIISILGSLFVSSSVFGALDTGIYKVTVKFGERLFTDLVTIDSEIQREPKPGYNQFIYAGTLTVPGNFTAKIAPLYKEHDYGDKSIEFKLKAKEFGRDLELDFVGQVINKKFKNGTITDPKTGKVIGSFHGVMLDEVGTK